MEQQNTLANPLEATANVKGYTFGLNTYWQDWVEAYDDSRPLADIGAAYGVNTIPAPGAGARGGYRHRRQASQRSARAQPPSAVAASGNAVRQIARWAPLCRHQLFWHPGE